MKPAVAEPAGPTGLMAYIENGKPLIVAVLLPAVLYVLWRMFGKTWRELDAEAAAARKLDEEQGAPWDSRPLVAMVLMAFILGVHEYYGGRTFSVQVVRPFLASIGEKLASVDNPDPLRLRKYDELWYYGYWVFSRVAGYLLPFPIWKLLYPKDSLLDMGLRIRGFFKHAWIYGLFLAVVIPAMLVVAQAPDFGSYYPFYRNSSRSYYDLLLWESMYFAQFFALELFFRGWFLAALKRSFGSGAIFAMAVPYCMIHFGKPYLETMGAVIAGIALGSLAMRTKSIYQGFLVHITVALAMDLLSLHHRGALPTSFWGGP